jgi:DNA polymerase-3 subunit gamma/tau
MRALSRMWQMLLKSLEEVAVAPNAMMAAEMAIIRLTHVAELPNPEDLVRKLQANPPTAPTGGGRAAPVPTGGNVTAQRHSPQPQTGGASAIANGGATALAEPAPNAALARFSQFEAVVDMIRANRDMQLLVEIEDNFRLAKYSPGRIEFQMTDSTSRELASKLASRLQSWTGVRWAVSVVSEGGGQTIREVRDAARDDLQAQALAHPMVQAVLAAFPGAEIREVKTAMDEPIDNVVPIDPDDVDDDWDPFEND